MTFSEMSKFLRKEKKISQIQLANALNVSKACISMIEIGKNEPTANTLIKYADFFQCSTDFLLGREDDFGNIVIPTATPSALRLSDREKKLLSAFKRLPEGLQDRTLAYVEDLGEAISPNLQKKSSGI